MTTSLRFAASTVLAATFALAAAACGDSQGRSGFDDGSSGGTSGTSGGTTGTSGGFGASDGGPTGSTAADDCSEAAKLVYVVSGENDLYSFTPNTLTFTKIGKLTCPSNGATPNSMAVDRGGTAWVNFSDGAIFKVSTKDASCTPTSFQKGQSGFIRFGMAFASNGPGSKDETLYVAGITDLQGGQGLAKIDTSTLQLTKIGEYSGALAGRGAELTGTGEGKLFGFFTTSPNATLAEIDKATGATSGDKPLTGVNTGLAFAFSFWGGDFWFYTSFGLASEVTRYAASGDKSIQKVKGDVGGFRIVGAGVSTCAPTAPPR